MPDKHMQEAWLQLRCPDCDKHWEAAPTALPSPETMFSCDDCGTERSLSEFMKTKRDLELLREFNQ